MHGFQFLFLSNSFIVNSFSSDDDLNVHKWFVIAIILITPRYNDEEHQIYIYDHDVGVEVRWDGESVARIRIDDRYHGKTKGTFLWATDRYRSQDKRSIFFMADTFCPRTGGM